MSQRIRVMLTEGPEGTPESWDVKSLESEPRVRILLGNRYEHFEFAHCYTKSGGESLPVYRWSYRTYIAE
ncbi:DUF5988 family protein [Streptomyces sp. NBC_00872]|uniref:DUF5988 family protein n=1 Tax=Streptomyces sp. NBC_00872 TaxID=2903686 RepID=UPI002F90E111